MKSSQKSASLARFLSLVLIMSVESCFAQALPPVRGEYTPGVSAINSGVVPEPGLTYANNFLAYSFDRFVTARGDSIFEQGNAAAFKDVNVFEWVFKKPILTGNFAVVAGLPFTSSSLTSVTLGAVSGSGFADFSFQPATFGWHLKRADLQAAYVFFAPTGRFVAGATDNVGAGFWTNAPTLGETIYLTKKGTQLSAYQMYEFHTTQEGTNVHPGQTMDLDYSLTQVLPLQKNQHTLLQFGVVGYDQWQTSNNSGPGVNPRDPGHYRVNAIGGAANITLPVRELAVGFKLFKEFSNSSTVQGFSLQITGAVTF